jgi:NTP pyrophosphatase (non-canonical NTP hydrolase)
MTDHPTPEGKMPNTTDATKPCRNHRHHCPGCGVVIDCDYVCCATCTPKFCSPFTPTPAPASREEGRTFSEVNRERCEAPHGFNHKLEDWSVSDWFTALVGEVGEAANVAKKLNRVRDGIRGNSESEDDLRAKLALELADVAVYLDLLAQRIGVDLDGAVVDAFNAKSEKLGCPIRWPGWRATLSRLTRELAEARAEATRLREAGKQFAEEIEHGCLACCGDGCEGAHVDDTREEIAAFRRALGGGA